MCIRDRLLDGLYATDDEERSRIIADTTTELVDEGNVIPLVELSGISATAPNVNGYKYEASSRLQLFDTWLAKGE